MTGVAGAGGGRRGLLLPLAALAVLLVPGGATAATVVNGDFESGTLKGWHVHRSIEAGNWFAYQGTDAPIGKKRKQGPSTVQAPPQGRYAATSDQANPDTLILYQDIALEPGSDYGLGLLAYYSSYEPIAVPVPDTLSVDEEVLDGQRNQQLRIDLMRPSAPLESLDPADILRTVFRTKPGDPRELPPTRLSTDLGAFAGQTVRLRIANAVHEEVFNAGVDAVALFRPGTGGQGQGQGSKPGAGAAGRLRLGRVRVDRRHGTAVLPVRVPGPGRLTASGRSAAPGRARARRRRARASHEAIRPVGTRAARAGTVRVRLRPNRWARAILRRRHRLRVVVRVVYRPAGGRREAASLPVLLRLRAHR